MPTALRPLPPDLDQIAPVERPFSTAEYRLMAEAGVFGDGRRVELIDGRIVAMSPILPPHLHTVRRLSNLLWRRLADAGLGDHDVVVQSTLALLDGTAPEPDFVLLRPGTPEHRLPGPADVVLVVEVSDSTLAFDRTVKRARYAQAGVPEMWVLDVAGRAVEVGRRPAGRAYADMARLGEGAVVGIEALPGLAPLPVADLFPAAS